MVKSKCHYIKYIIVNLNLCVDYTWCVRSCSQKWCDTLPLALLIFISKMCSFFLSPMFDLLSVRWWRDIICCQRFLILVILLWEFWPSAEKYDQWCDWLNTSADWRGYVFTSIYLYLCLYSCKQNHWTLEILPLDPMVNESCAVVTKCIK